MTAAQPRAITCFPCATVMLLVLQPCAARQGRSRPPTTPGTAFTCACDAPRVRYTMCVVHHLSVPPRGLCSSLLHTCTPARRSCCRKPTLLPLVHLSGACPAKEGETQYGTRTVVRHAVHALLWSRPEVSPCPGRRIPCQAWSSPYVLPVRQWQQHKYLGQA